MFRPTTWLSSEWQNKNGECKKGKVSEVPKIITLAKLWPKRVGGPSVTHKKL
jgi:hypothetical protein